MASSIRRATARDLIDMQDCNVKCLPDGETHGVETFREFLVSWPPLQHVAQALNGHIVGYVLASVDELKEEGGCDGHIKSIAVSRPYRRAGLATRLMNAVHTAMIEVFDVEYAYLRVRTSNQGAVNFFTNTLGYTQYKLEKDYYGHGDDGFAMRKLLKKRETFFVLRPESGGGSRQVEEMIRARQQDSKREPKPGQERHDSSAGTSSRT